MNATQVYRRARAAHFFKVWLFIALTMPPIGFLGQYLPQWLFLMVFFGYVIFVLFPVCFAIGPIGRRYGRALNEAAIAHAKAEREGCDG